MAGNLNLTPERGPNVWDKAAGNEERKWEVGAAVLLAAGAVSMFVGGMMLYRTMRRERPLPLRGRRETADGSDQVTEESQQSFPASDSPSWTPAEGATLDLPRRT